MSQNPKERITFDVETSRVLQILSSEIYDSPKAFLRENVQNAYDAILMRCTAQQVPIEERSIKVTIEDGRLTVSDDGIGMPDSVLKDNFWKAGSSGKKSELAQQSGVIGTFGIGAMANFGVCTELCVETRHIESNVTLISTARRDDLKIAHDCIDLEHVIDSRGPGTLIAAGLDPSYRVSEEEACEYLRQYVRFLPVPVVVNGRLVSQEKFEETFAGSSVGFEQISSREILSGGYTGTLHVLINAQNRLLVRFVDISLNGIPIKGEVFLVQQNGPVHGFRNYFGLAPIPVSGCYGLGGFVNLEILNPTAGREALSRDSIQHVANLINLVEAEASKDIADTDAADSNQQFQQYILTQGHTQLAHRVKISALPEDTMIELGEVRTYEENKSKHFYQGRDPTILREFANEQANLLHVSQNNPRRKLQLRFLTEIAKVNEVPDQVLVNKIESAKLSIDEAMFLVSLRGVLLDDYLMLDVDVAFASISHGVAFHVQECGGELQISIARDLPAVEMVLECYKTARDVFDGFMKDFVRQHLYPHIRDHVPSSKKQGRDALYERLQRNKELFRLQRKDYAPIESVLSDFLAGKVQFSDVLVASRGHGSAQYQQVSKAQVGSVERELPSLMNNIATRSPTNVHEAIPPIMREEVETDMKVLTIEEESQMINNFQMFLALSDRLVKREGEFLRWPHTTRLMWGGPRVTYIFTDPTGQLHLYYDIELKASLQTDQTGGAMLPTTTIFTKNRVFVPVPQGLEHAFQITNGDKEFYVRFDTIP